MADISEAATSNAETSGASPSIADSAHSLEGNVPTPPTINIKQSERWELKEQFLADRIFHGLRDLNTGFDAPAIKYFSKEDFEIVLQRAEEHRVWITGIEPW